MTTLVLYHFKYFDPVSGMWLRSRYAAEREVVAQRHAQFEIIKPPEVREVSDDLRALTAGHLARRPGER
jgi:hypothetical protein